MTSAAKAEFYPLFDWARVALAMAVAVGHSGLITAPYVGDLAVQVFFALSGWLIGGILYDSAPADLPRFYFNRVMRIWTPYFAAIVLVFGVSLLKEPPDATWREYLFYDLTFTHNLFITPRIDEIVRDLPMEGTNNGFWSLSVEEQFYLGAPLVILFMRGGRSVAAWLAIAAGAFAFELYASVAFGVLAVVLKRRHGDWHLHPVAQAMLGAVLLATGAAIHLKAAPYGHVAPLFAVSALLLMARTGKGSAAGTFFGGLSYPLYLNHWVGIFVANEIFQRFPVVGFAGTQALAAIANLAFAALAYRAIDVEVRKRRARLYTPKRGMISAALAYGLIVVGVIGGAVYAMGRG